MAHTPGPWEWDYPVWTEYDVTQYAPWLIQTGSDGRVSVLMGVIHAKNEADAKLIAAAPELLGVLKDLRERLLACGSLHTAEDAYDSFYQEIVDEAIAKAEGK